MVVMAYRVGLGDSDLTAQTDLWQDATFCAVFGTKKNTKKNEHRLFWVETIIVEWE